MINWFSIFLHSWFYSSYCISMSSIWVIFSKIKEIINVNRCIIFSLKKSVMIKSMIIVNYAPFYLISNYWPWSLWKLLFTWFYISDRLLGCQEQPLLERYAWNLNMFASLSFVNTICPWKPHTFMWQNLEERSLWLALQKSIFLCDYLAKSDGVFTEL